MADGMYKPNRRKDIKRGLVFVEIRMMYLVTFTLSFSKLDIERI